MYRLLNKIKIGENMKAKLILINIGIILLAISISVSTASADSGRGSISGYKVNDTNGNGFWDKGEKGIQGWTIYLIGFIQQDTGYGHGNKIIKRQVKTNKNDYYEFKNLPEGTYQITEEFNKNYRPTTPFVITLKLKDGQKAANNNFLNQPIKKKK